MTPGDFSSPPPDLAREFRTTHWSVVLTASAPSSAETEAAWERLARDYWYPLYLFVRRQGHGPEDAGDFTQDFFVHLIEHRALARVHPDKGRFRMFLLASLRHLLANKRDFAQARKRGGGRAFVPLDEPGAEERLRLEADATEPPDRAFERSWAETVVRRSLETLEQEWRERYPRVPFGEVKAFLVEARGAQSFADGAARAGLGLAAFKSAVLRLRQRHRAIFRQTVAQTVAEPSELEAEMRHLLTVLST